MSTVKLKRLKINQYRNVRPGTELHFDDGVNLVLGQNAAGKTTLLGLLSMVCSWHFAELEDEEFDIEFEMHQGPRIFRCALSNRRTITAPEVESFAYEFRFSYGTPAVQLHGTPSALTIIEPSTENRQIPFSPFRPNFLEQLISALPGSNVDFLTRAMVATTLIMGTPYRFDEGLACFYALTGELAPESSPAGLTATTIGQTLLFDLTKTPARITPSVGQSPFATPTILLDEIFAGAGPDWTPFATIPSDKIAFLREAVKLLGFVSATLRPIVASASGPIGRRKIRMGGFEFMFTRRDGTAISHQLLSYGQKRLLAFYYYLACNGNFLIADELVNGLHHHWIKVCMGEIGTRQAFLTSQNPLLFEHIRFDSIEQVQARFITCKSELIDGAEQLVWQNMPRDDAERFYRGYEADIEGIGDILINRGLW